jgi:hypothetical protein
MMRYVDAYLLGYNVISLLGWLNVLARALGCRSFSSPLSESSPACDTLIWPWLSTLQLLSGLELLHSVAGLVNSSITAALPQFLARSIPVWVALQLVPETRVSVFFWGTALAWSIADSSRYMLYACTTLEAMSKKPLPGLRIVKWLRYSLFYVLYPSGAITETGLMYLSVRTITTLWPMGGLLVQLYAYVLLWLGLAYMMQTMHSSRKKYLNPPKPSAPRPKGICFPGTTAETPSPSTASAGVEIIAAAIRATGNHDAADSCAKSRSNWRFGYVEHFERLVANSCTSPDAAVKAAQAGLDFAYDNFVFIDEAGNAKDGVRTFRQEMQRVVPPSDRLHVGRVSGTVNPPLPFSVPYKNAELSGDALLKQLDVWTKYGVLEADAASAIAQVAENAQWRDLTGHAFVLIGAGSAMGPYLSLLKCGATIIALDIPGSWNQGTKRATSSLWQRLIDAAKASPGGELIFPLSKCQTECKTDIELCESAGANLMHQPAQVLEFLLRADVALTPKPLVIGNYTYLDSGDHVKLSLAADALINGVIAARNGRMTAVAFLCTPTDIHLVNAEVQRATVANKKLSLVEGLLHCISFGTYLQPAHRKPFIADDGSELHWVNCLTRAQGPNYALAKRIQHFRAVLAYEAGVTVSSNVAPSTRTLSVLHNRTFAWAYGGMPYVRRP